jgi:predicted nucleic acid-binding protein
MIITTIDVSKVVEISADYSGVMGISVTFVYAYDACYLELAARLTLPYIDFR